MSDEGRDAVAGRVAIEIARQLAEPIRALRDRLGLVVDHLERHIVTSTGPAPYPWRSVQALRQDLGGAYLEVTSLARRVDELDRALALDEPGLIDVAAAVDLGVRLASHHLASDLELLVDLGGTPPARGTPGLLALVVAHLTSICARSARALPGSTLTVRVGADGPFAVVLVADNGAGSPHADAVGALVRDILAPWGATIDAASAEGQGCAFELRFPTAP